MESKPLVSIITPCHNSENYLFRLMDSILSQTYPNIEMITVDNDSKDKTPDIIMEYVPKFIEKGYALKYIHQDDLGPSAGIQTGLRHVKGDYLLMPDSDDYYACSTAIETFVNKFLSLPEEYAIIRSQLIFINEKDMKPMGMAYEHFPEDDPGTLFEDCLFAKNDYNFAAINYMVKVSALRELTGMEIYNTYNIGQQRQICLPLYYKYKAWTISKPLVCYLVRESSVSHGEYSKYPTKVLLYKKAPDYIDSILSCIPSMPAEKKEEYRRGYLRMRAKDMAIMAINTNHFSDVKTYFDDYKKNGGDVSPLRHRLIWKYIQYVLGFFCQKNKSTAK